MFACRSPHVLPILLTLAGLLLTGQARADEKAVAADFKSLQGTWIVVEAQHDGNALDRIKEHKLIVKDQQFTIVTASAELKGDLTIDPAKSPKSIDFQHQEGQLREKRWEGIYKLEDDRLTLCYTEADANRERPNEFATQAGQSRLLIVVMRQK